MPLHFDLFWLSSSQENIGQILTSNVVQKVGAGKLDEKGETPLDVNSEPMEKKTL
jgi:hypothetical protein